MSAVPPVCIWCGLPLSGTHEDSSFLFLASRGGGWTSSPGAWDDAGLEGHQFYCHAPCFRASVPDYMQYGLRLGLDDEGVDPEGG